MQDTMLESLVEVLEEKELAILIGKVALRRRLSKKLRNDWISKAVTNKQVIKLL